MLFRSVIPDMVKISGVSYKVTAVADGAFRGNKKIKTVVIGGNTASIGAKAFCQCTSLTKAVISESVSKIGKMAFYGCRKLKNIQIKTRALTTKNVGKNAFRGIYAKAVIKTPKKKLKAYKKLLKGKGIGKKVKSQKSLKQTVCAFLQNRRRNRRRKNVAVYRKFLYLCKKMVDKLVFFRYNVTCVVNGAEKARYQLRGVAQLG